MKASPLNHQTSHSWRQLARKDRQTSDVKDCLIFTILGMEVGWVVVVKEHLDNDTEEPTDFRHEMVRVAMRGRGLPVSFW